MTMDTGRTVPIRTHGSEPAKRPGGIPLPGVTPEVCIVALDEVMARSEILAPIVYKATPHRPAGAILDIVEVSDASRTS